MAYFTTCPHCGAHLDPGEYCDCMTNNEKFNVMLNSLRHRREIMGVLEAVARAMNGTGQALTAEQAMAFDLIKNRAGKRAC